jgi:hypothetical protein
VVVREDQKAAVFEHPVRFGPYLSETTRKQSDVFALDFAFRSGRVHPCAASQDMALPNMEEIRELR